MHQSEKLCLINENVTLISSLNLGAGLMFWKHVPFFVNVCFPNSFYLQFFREFWLWSSERFLLVKQFNNMDFIFSTAFFFLVIFYIASNWLKLKKFSKNQRESGNDVRLLTLKIVQWWEDINFWNLLRWRNFFTKKLNY